MFVGVSLALRVSGRPMDCGMLASVRLLVRDTQVVDVAPLMLPLLVALLVASPLVALVLKAVLEKSVIYALKWIWLKVSQGHLEGPQSVKKGDKRAVAIASGRNGFA